MLPTVYVCVFHSHPLEVCLCACACLWLTVLRLLVLDIVCLECAIVRVDDTVTLLLSCNATCIWMEAPHGQHQHHNTHIAMCSLAAHVRPLENCYNQQSAVSIHTQLVTLSMRSCTSNCVAKRIGNKDHILYSLTRAPATQLFNMKQGHASFQTQPHCSSSHLKRHAPHVAGWQHN